MKTLLTGGTGLIGSYILSNYAGEGAIIAPKRDEMDVVNQKQVCQVFEIIRPSVVIHAAAKVRILAGEKERGDKKGDFWRVNVEGTANIVKNCLKYKCHLIFFSAEVVFAGTPEHPGPYSENEKLDEDDMNLSWYGLTKKEAEKIVLTECSRSAVVRLCSVVGGCGPRRDYLESILWDFDHKHLNAKFDDQYIGLTHVDDVVETINKLAADKVRGVFHVASIDQCTPYDLSCFLLEKKRGVKGVVERASVKEYLEEYPCTFIQYGGLKSKKTQKLLGLRLDTWKVIVTKKMRSLNNFNVWHS